MKEDLFLKLRLLAEAGQTNTLRHLACWTARQTLPNAPFWVKSLDMIEASIGQEPLGRICWQIREQGQGAAIAAGTIGMRVSPASASALLACFQCAHLDAYLAATRTIDMALQWYRHVTEQDDDEAFLEHIQDKLDALLLRTGPPG